MKEGIILVIFFIHSDGKITCFGKNAEYTTGLN